MNFADQINQLARAVDRRDPFTTANNGSRIAHERAVALRDAIERAVERRPGIGATAVAAELEITRETASAHLQALKKAGRIARLPGFYSGWAVVDAICPTGIPCGHKK